jgi:hypothetical protein
MNNIRILTLVGGTAIGLNYLRPGYETTAVGLGANVTKDPAKEPKTYSTDLPPEQLFPRAYALRHPPHPSFRCVQPVPVVSACPSLLVCVRACTRACVRHSPAYLKVPAEYRHLYMPREQDSWERAAEEVDAAFDALAKGKSDLATAEAAAEIAAATAHMSLAQRAKFVEARTAAAAAAAAKA